MSNSPLASYTKLSPNHSGPRNHAIDTITIHCMAGNLSVETCGAMFAKKERKASSNYGIDSNGRIGLYVPENCRSWCSSNAANDHRAVTIEVANTEAKDPWPISDKAYAALIDLLVDICQRNGIKRLLWRGDKNLVGQVDKQNMTVHRWFAAKACPGDWLYERHGQIAKEVNERLEKGGAGMDNIEELRGELTSCANTGDNPSEWARDCTEYCKRKGIFAGDGNGNFGWHQPITREAVACIVARTLEAAGLADKLPDVR